MKKLMIISSIVLGCSLQATAQIPESSYIVGGSSSFNLTTNPDDGKILRASFSIRPEIGKFVSEKWLIGGGVGYSISQSQSSNGFLSNSARTQEFSGNFSATRFYPLAEKFYFTCEYGLGVSYSFTHYESLMNSVLQIENSTSETSSGIAVSPGLAYFINNKWMIYARMGSLSYRYAHNLDTKTGYHNVGYHLRANSFGIGARYILGAKS